MTELKLSHKVRRRVFCNRVGPLGLGHHVEMVGA